MGTFITPGTELMTYAETRALQNTGGALSYIADERTGMQQATLAKGGFEAA